MNAKRKEACNPDTETCDDVVKARFMALLMIGATGIAVMVSSVKLGIDTPCLKYVPIAAVFVFVACLLYLRSGEIAKHGHPAAAPVDDAAGPAEANEPAALAGEQDRQELLRTWSQW